MFPFSKILTIPSSDPAVIRFPSLRQEPEKHFSRKRVNVLPTLKKKIKIKKQFKSYFIPWRTDEKIISCENQRKLKVREALEVKIRRDEHSHLPLQL